MTSLQAIELRGGVGGVMSVASLVAWRLAPRLRMSADTFFRSALAAFALTRLGAFIVAFGVLHFTPRGDIILYMQEALPALAGKLVYRDFLTPHAPLNSYLFALMLRLHNSSLTIMLFGILFDIAAMIVWFKCGQYFLSTLTLRRAALLLICNPTSLLTEGIDGQMNSFIALFLGLGVWLVLRQKHFLSGAAVAMPVAVIKFLTLIYAPGFLFAVRGMRQKVIATLGFVGVLLVAYVPFALAGADLREPLTQEGAHKTSSNLVFLVESLTGHSLGLHLPDVLLALSWLAVVVLTFVSMRAVSGDEPKARRSTLLLLSISLIAELLCVQIFSKNTWDRYLVMAMFPLCLVAAELSWREMLGYGVWLFTLCFEPSYWAGILGLPEAGDVHRGMFSGNPRLIFFFCLQIIVVGGSVFMLLTCTRALVRLRRPETQPEGIFHPALMLPA